MASTPPGAKKKKVEYVIDQATWEDFMKTCSKKGYAPQVVVEQFMRKFNQTGQI
jgi:hypothetical protein